MRSVHEASRDELRKVALRAYVPGNAPGAGASTQPVEEDAWTPNEAIRPPLDPDLLAAQTMLSPTRRSCIAAITLNTVGLGFKIEPIEGMEEEAASGDEPSEIQRALDELARRDLILGRPSFTRLLSAAQWDRQEVGQGAIEVSRNRTTGEIDGLYHVPGKRLRRRTDRRGWIIGPRKRRSAAETTHYYDFGDKVQYDAEGRPTPVLVDSGRRWDQNELIVFRLYTSQSRDYGLPPDAQLAIDYLGDKNAAKENAERFGSSNVPPTVIFVQGKEAEGDSGEIEVEVPPEFVQAVTNTLSSAHPGARVAVVPLPPGVETDKVDLAVLSERDLGNVAFRADNRRRTLGAFRLSPIFVADIEDAGKYTAEVERAITKEQVFDAEQTEIGDVLDQTLIREIAPAFRIAFNEIEIKTDEAKRESADALADRGLITNGDYRAAHGYPPMPERAPGEPDPTDTEGGEPDGKVPAGWNSALVERRAVALNPLDPEAAERETRRQEIEKRGLAGELEEDFDRAVTDAMRSVATMADDAELRPVVVEKLDGGEIVVRPYVREGDPA